MNKIIIIALKLLGIDNHIINSLIECKIEKKDIDNLLKGSIVEIQYKYNIDLNKFSNKLQNNSLVSEKIEEAKTITNNAQFREVEMWGIAPSSGLELNDNMLKFKDIARVMMKRREPRQVELGNKQNNIFLRYKPISKSHYMGNDERIRLGASRHFKSMKLNDAYDVKGKTICIFDDYLTNGNTFEAMRNILKYAGAKQIIFVSLGRFARDYYYQNYELNGNVYYEDSLKYKLIDSRFIEGSYDEEARLEVENLHRIFNL